MLAGHFLRVFDMIKMSLHELGNILKTPSAGSSNVYFQGISTDTRILKEGNLFVALRGEKFNGHDFAENALQKGASCLLVSQKLPLEAPQIIVEDTLIALGKLAADWRSRFDIPLIGVTGSNGKTTLKNMLASILRAACNNTDEVLATHGNFNNQIGLPLTLLALDVIHRYAVIEMGMNHLGEIEYLTHIAKPKVAVITNAAACHLEGVKDLAGVAKAKGEIFSGLSRDGVAILNRDDTFFDYWRGLIGDHRFLSFGFHKNADIYATSSDSDEMILHTPKGSIDIRLPLLGMHNRMNALAAATSSFALHQDLATIKKGLEMVAPAKGRMQEYFLETGVRVIDDTYNANPFSLQAALDTLATLSGTKILVLGDMRELGPDALEYHKTAGEKIRDQQIDYLFTCGELSQEASRAFGKNAQHFDKHDTLIHALKPYLKKDVILLVKGSRSMQMEKVIAAIVPTLK